MKISKELERAIGNAKDLIEQRRRIENEIQKAVSMQPGAEARLQDALEGLGDAEADAALSGQPTNSRGAQTALSAARDAVDALAARILGLNRKLMEQEENIIAANEHLARLRNEFCDAAIAEYRASFLKAAEVFLEVLRVGSGLSDGLGAAFPGLDGIEVLDPVTRQTLTRFDGDPNANRTYRAAREQVSHVRSEAEAIARIAESIIKARQDRDALKLVPSRNPQPGVLGTYTGLSEAEWREAQENAPRGMGRIVTAA